MKRSPWLWLALGASCLQLLLFVALDRRPPDDHDDFYTADCIPWIAALRQSPLPAWPGLLGEQWDTGELHPRLAQTALTASLGAVGPSRAAYRLVNLPFLLLLVWGTALVARELGARRPGLAALAVAAAPIVVNASRKWDIQFHAAALTPLGLWFLLRALRSGSGAARWWLLFGAWQGLRLHTHPIVSTDVVITAGLALLFLAPTARRAGVRPGARLGLWALAASVTGWLALRYSGLAPALVGAPEHDFVGYLAARENYSGGWWIGEASPVAWAGLAVQMLAEISWVHLLPSGLFLLLAGLGAAAFGRKRLGEGRSLLLIPVLLALAQIPPAILAVSNKAFLNDWLFVLPGLVAVALVGIERCLSARAGRVLMALLAVHGAWVLAGPFAATAIGPEIVDEPGWYDRGPLRPFTRSSSGRHLITHHLVSRFSQPGEVLGQRLQEHAGPGRAARFDVYDLRFDPAVGGGPGCRLGPADGAWTWGWPSGLDAVADRPPSDWPLVFAGFDSALALRPDRTEGVSPARFAVVRLWVTPTERWSTEAQTCRPAARLPEGWVGAAEALALDRLGGGAELLEDPAGWFTGRVIEWDRSPAYVGSALLIDRRTGETHIEQQPDPLRDDGAAEGRSEAGAHGLVAGG